MAIMAKAGWHVFAVSIIYVVALRWVCSDVAVAGFILREGEFKTSPTPSMGSPVNDYINCSSPSEALNILFLTGTPTADLQNVQSNSVSGNCLHGLPFRLLGPDNFTALSFSTTFTFSLVPVNSTPGESIDGLAFVIIPALSAPPENSSSGYLGLLNAASNDLQSSHTFAVEFDSFPNAEFNDSLQDHVGIDLNSLTSSASTPVGYYDTDCSGDETFKPIAFKNGSMIQAWIEYNASTQHIYVTVSPLPGYKPPIPLLDTEVQLSGIIQEEMYIGFSSSTGAVGGYSYVYDWSFNVNESADPLYSDRVPLQVNCPKNSSKANLPLILGISLPMALLAIVATATLGGFYLRNLRRSLDKRLHDLMELENLEYRPKKYSYKELSAATQGFSSTKVLGSGGFGSVYMGTLPGGADGRNDPVVVAVKRIAPEAMQGEQEFVAEVEIIGRLRHRNLVQLLGWCREKDELLLVYEYMVNGSLDRWLFNRRKTTGTSDECDPILTWNQRLRILCGVANALVYLHDEWKQVVVHRDVKASNVMLDSVFNGKLGDFGLARFHEHKQQEFRSTHVAGTMGYLAPEARSLGRFTDKSDVFSFGALALEVTSGRRPVDVKRPAEEIILIMWVWELYEQGRLLDAVDDNLSAGTNSIDVRCRAELEAVLRIGLLCCHPDADSRPTMGQVVQMLKGEAPLLPIASFPNRCVSRTASFSFAFGDSYHWAEHSVELGMIENSEEIKLIPVDSPKSETSSVSNDVTSTFSFVL